MNHEDLGVVIFHHRLYLKTLFLKMNFEILPVAPTEPEKSKQNVKCTLRSPCLPLTRGAGEAGRR